MNHASYNHCCVCAHMRPAQRFTVRCLQTLAESLLSRVNQASAEVKQEHEKLIRGNLQSTDALA